MEMLAVVAVAVLRVLGLVAVWNYDVGKIKQQLRACFETSEFAEKGEGHQVGEKGFEAVVSVLLLFLAEQELA
jgi:hypothetical protein